jgi:two-component system cell cycle sensor histidine kinase/response regulator CckA
MYRICGLEPDAFHPSVESFQRLLHTDDVATVSATIQNVLEDRQPRDHESRIIRPDGQVRILHCRCHVIVDEHGHIASLVGTAQDVTDRKADEEILETSKRRLRTIIDAAPACVKLISADGRLLDMNPAGLKMIDASDLSQVTGQSLVDLVHPDDRRKYLEAHQAASNGSPRRIEFRVVGFNGRVIWVDAHFVPFDAGGEGRDAQHAVLSVTSDVTERKHLEEQLRQSQKMEAIGRLAGEIAHDFNNLLTVIGGLTETALETVEHDHPAAADDLREVLKTSMSAAALTRQLLLFSRKGVVQTTAVDLNAAIADLESLLRRTIGEDNLLVVELADGLNHIVGDATKLQQVIMNLVVNARDAMPQGGALTIQTKGVDLDEASAAPIALVPGRYVALTVADTGIGMTHETRAHIFEPFFTTKEREQGTGLGLAVVYGIVQNLGGAITVDSDPRRGTIFTLLFPESLTKAESCGKEEARHKDPLGNETVLLVEDDSRVREYAARILRKGGYEVIEASNPAQALELSKQEGERVDALVTDVVMPGIDGFELAERLRSTHARLRVLYISGYPKESMHRRRLAIDRSGLLEKPFTATHLLQRVRELLDSSAV